MGWPFTSRLWSMTQGWDLDKQRRTLQVSISKRERLAGTLVFQASERNKNRRGRETYHLLPFVIPVARLRQLRICHVVSGLRWAAGCCVLVPGPVLKVVGFGGGLWGRGGPGEGGVLLQGWREHAAMAFEGFGSNFPPACQRPPRGTRTCVFSCVRSLITHSFIHSFIRSSPGAQLTHPGVTGPASGLPASREWQLYQDHRAVGNVKHTHEPIRGSHVRAPREAVVPILLPHPPTPLLYRGLSFSCKKCVAASCAQKFFNQRTFADE